jgi:hypothetical protein
MFSSSATQSQTQLYFTDYEKQPAYIGCWIGMRAGKLKITSNKIYDVGSKENSLYEKQTTSENEIYKGLQTGEKYLLKTENDFPKSFLAKWIKLSFNNDGTVGVTTYDSHNDYLYGNFVGQGLFEKIPCKNLK